MAATGSVLFSPMRIGGLELKNRVVMPPMGTNLGDKEGLATQRTIDYYRARAEGGAGLIVVEGA
ncbi:MAG: hypothetical protein QGF81_02270, partial [Dehalococcoidia bacterium]|nr:hypothetical protein [Dehalococcoidia bacterium]